MILLSQLGPEMKLKSVSQDRLAAVTNIEKPRIRKLMYPSMKVEPWFEEAVAITRAIGVSGINQLVGVPGDDMRLAPGLPMALPNDLDMLRAGVRLPLGLAYNIAIKLGLRDPMELVIPPLLRELWRIVATGERGCDAGNCPWCDQIIDGDIGHLPTCLPNNLMGGRGEHMATVRPPRPPRKGEESGSMPAKGLKALRAKLGYTQKEMAFAVGCDQFSYPHLERCDRPLTSAMARRFCQALGVNRETLYIDPNDV